MTQTATKAQSKAPSKRSKKARSDPEKEAIERLREIAFDPTLDKIWAKHPADHTSAEREALVTSLRNERALWNAIVDRRERNKAARAKEQATPDQSDEPDDEW